MTINNKRDELLAFVAEKYFLEDHRQSDIAEMIGVTRSAVSRMLSEARDKGIVEIIIHHPFHFDHELEDRLKETFNLKHTAVVSLSGHPDYNELRKQLGIAGSRMLSSLIKPGDKIGVAWGTTVQATIEAFEPSHINHTRVVQLVGVLGSTRHSYSAQTLVEHLAQKIGGEGTYLYSPFIVENEKTAASLLMDPAVEQSLAVARECDIALMGIGTTKPEYCSLFKGNHITRQTLETIQGSGAVGDVCALYFDISGNLAKADFHQRRIGASLEDLKEINNRLAVAGNTEKSEAILGAIRGGFITSLVTDNHTAQKVLDLT